MGWPNRALCLQAAAILCTTEAQMQIMSQGQRSMVAQTAQPSTAPAEVSAAQAEQNNSERIAKIEAVLPYLATKADIADLRAELKTEIQKLRADLTWRIIITMGIMMGIMTGVFTLVNLLLRTQAVPDAPGG